MLYPKGKGAGGIPSSLNHTNKLLSKRGRIRLYDIGTGSNCFSGFFDFFLAFSIKAMTVDWEVRAGKGIPEETHDVRWSPTNAHGDHFHHGSWYGISFPS